MTPVTPSNSLCNGQPPDFSADEWEHRTGVLKLSDGTGILLIRYHDGVSTVQSRIRPIPALGKCTPVCDPQRGHPETGHWCWKPVD